jgi:hypothetical protein
MSIDNFMPREKFAPAGRTAWRIDEWAANVGLCRASVYNLFAQKKIASVKAGKARLIVTSPADYIASLPQV